MKLLAQVCEFSKHAGRFSVYVMGHAQILIERA